MNPPFPKKEMLPDYTQRIICPGMWDEPLYCSKSRLKTSLERVSCVQLQSDGKNYRQSLPRRFRFKPLRLHPGDPREKAPRASILVQMLLIPNGRRATTLSVGFPDCSKRLGLENSKFVGQLIEVDPRRNGVRMY